MREQYRARGWALGDPDRIAQCKREGLYTRIVQEQESGEGCHVKVRPRRSWTCTHMMSSNRMTGACDVSSKISLGGVECVRDSYVASSAPCTQPAAGMPLRIRACCPTSTDAPLAFSPPPPFVHHVVAVVAVMSGARASIHRATWR